MLGRAQHGASDVGECGLWNGSLETESVLLTEMAYTRTAEVPWGWGQVPVLVLMMRWEGMCDGMILWEWNLRSGVILLAGVSLTCSSDLTKAILIQESN